MDCELFNGLSGEDSTPAEDRDRPKGNGPQAGGEAAPLGCLSNTQGGSSLFRMKNNPEYQAAGGVDWFEWSGRVHWTEETRYASLRQSLLDAKSECQQKAEEYKEVMIPEFGPVRVYRTGRNRGGDRGQHYELRLRASGIAVGLSLRDISPEDVEGKSRRKCPAPNFFCKQSGRDSLLSGPVHGFELAMILIEKLGGSLLNSTCSRGDLCIDIPHLHPKELHKLVANQQFVCRPTTVRPHDDYCTGETTGFEAGKNPARMIVYNKAKQLWGNTDRLYIGAIVQRRWGGVVPLDSTRIEFQLHRPWLREHGIDTPMDFLAKLGTLTEYLTYDFFRITDAPVDRKNKHQSRVATHPLWQDVADAFRAIYGEPVGDLRPIDRTKIEPIELLKQGRGCLLNALLQTGATFTSYREFVKEATDRLLRLGEIPGEVKKFLNEAKRRRMDYEG